MKNKLVLKGSILLLILFYNISIYCKTNSDIYFYHLGLKDGLSQINIMSIYQDELGTMWFGTTEGLNRYNGMDIQTFKPSKGENGLTQNTIYSIQGNQAGAIYIHADNDLIRYDIARQQLKPLYQGSIRAIFYSDSLLWTVTDKRILVYSEQTKAFKEYATLNKDIANVTSIYVSKDGVIWLGTTDGLVTIRPNNRREQTYVLKGERIHTLYEDRKQNIWAGTAKDGVYEISVFGNTINDIRLRM